jgi:hypothetical protein
MEARDANLINYFGGPIDRCTADQRATSTRSDLDSSPRGIVLEVFAVGGEVWKNVIPPLHTFHLALLPLDSHQTNVDQYRYCTAATKLRYDATSTWSLTVIVCRDTGYRWSSEQDRRGQDAHRASTVRTGTYLAVYRTPYILGLPSEDRTDDPMDSSTVQVLLLVQEYL